MLSKIIGIVYTRKLNTYIYIYLHAEECCEIFI